MPKLKFSIDSALLSELGERLVESTHVALLELVKNAYDADATKVLITVDTNDTTHNCFIQIKDDGSGMSYQQVKDYWMRIATTNKVKNNKSLKYGRWRSGSKGIGRFSCRRLGTKLKLVTTAKIGKAKFVTTELLIDWDDFVAGTDLDEITCSAKTEEQVNRKTGTYLEIFGGNSKDWNKRGWGVLKRRLILLISNRGRQIKGYDRDPGFNINLRAPSFEEESIVNPRDQLMNAGWGRIRLQILKDGTVKWKQVAKGISPKSIEMVDKFPELAGTTADIAIVPHDKSYFRKPQLITKRLLDTLNDWGGVHIRHNGIMVPPFGELGNDWLKIDYDKGRRLAKSTYSPIVKLSEELRDVTAGRELLNILSSKSYVGEVNVVSPSNVFQMKASREGFVGELAIRTLRQVIRFGVDFSTVYRDYYIRLMERKGLEKARESFSAFIEEVDISTTEEILEKNKKNIPNLKESKPLKGSPLSNNNALRSPSKNVMPNKVESLPLTDSAIDYVIAETKNLSKSLPYKERKIVLDNVSKATEIIQKEKDIKNSELNYLRVVASNNSVLQIFQHEVKSLIALLGQHELNLQTLTKGLDQGKIQEIKKIQNDLRSTKNNFNGLLIMTSILSANEKSAGNVALLKRVDKAVRCFNGLCEKYKIKVDINEIKPALKIRDISEAELLSILLNALSNSIKSVIACGKTRKIKISAYTKDDKVIINILDTGIGVDYKNDDIFNSYISDPQKELYPKLKSKINPDDSYFVGTGGGLGLSIIREITTFYKGSTNFRKAEPPWKCHLEIQLPL